MKLPDKSPFQADSNTVACRKMRQLWKIEQFSVERKSDAMQ